MCIGQLKIFMVGMVMLCASAAWSMEVSEIVSKANQAAYYKGEDGRAKVHMSIFDAQGRERNRDFTILRRDDTNEVDAEQKFFVYFTRPSDVSKTVFLVWKKINQDDDRWLYLPALDLVKRIAASDERTSFVGSHFFYEDVSGRAIDEDEHTLLEQSKNYYVVKSTPKNANAVEFAYYKNWIHRETFIPVKTEYYDNNDTLYRTYSALKVEEIDGFQTVTQSRMADSRIGGYTEMSYSDVKYNVGLADDLFSERYLRNPPRRELR